MSIANPSRHPHLRYADKIIVFEDDQITQYGTHQEFLAQPGDYSELNTLQQLEQKNVKQQTSNI